MNLKESTRPIRRRLANVLVPSLYDARYKRKYERPFIKNVPSNKEIIGCEIGVRLGDNALRILNNLSIKRLYLIDPYINATSIDDGKKVISSEKAFERCKQKLSAFSEKCVFLRCSSTDGVKKISEKLDFAYIDGNHSYGCVKDDLLNFWEKIKPNGVLGGHDFEPRYWNDVVKAVLEFGNKINQPVKFEGCEFWFYKP